MFGRLVIIILGLLGAGGVSQGPEIASQYEQRIGGALSELRTIIDQFDSDVAKNGLTRTEALATYRKSTEPFLKDRGVSMQKALDRFDNLTKQSTTFNQSNELYKPVHVILEADQDILQGVMEDYTAGLPVTASGILYALLGAFLGCLFGWGFRRACGLDTRPSKIHITE